MNKLFSIFIFVVVITLNISAQNIAFKNVNVIPMDKEQVLPNQTVLIKDGIISEIGGKVNVPKDAQIIDGTGKYLIPGLIDMHVHLTFIGEETIPILPVYGITSVRDMGGDIQKLKDWRAQIESGKLIGPRLKFCGPMLEGTKDAIPPDRTDHWLVANPEQARETVTKLAKEGVDCIKMRSYANPETYFALAAAAKENNLPLVGHAPWGVDPIQSSNAGQRSYEHGWYPDPWKTLTPEKKNEFSDTFRKNNSLVVPTLITWETRRFTFDVVSAVVNDYEAKSDPRLKLISALLRKSWLSDLKDIKAMNTGSPGWIKALDSEFDQIAEMHEQGVEMMAGTDTGALMVYPGAALHQELKLLVNKCRFTPFESLRTATIIPAKFFKMENKLGTIEKGKFADLVLLSANPLQDISNIQKIDGVMLNGKWFDRKELDRITSEVETKISNSREK
ncbi:MAG TPA: amidohydrolase family protein [Pyrinomonadaceae bacterium]|nr:amidohydrolase family protein [Pyrinomonadaceae bacterium]